jgi:hypothetical protein
LCLCHVTIFLLFLTSATPSMVFLCLDCSPFYSTWLLLIDLTDSVFP